MLRGHNAFAIFHTLVVDGRRVAVSRRAIVNRLTPGAPPARPASCGLSLPTVHHGGQSVPPVGAFGQPLSLARRMVPPGSAPRPQHDGPVRARVGCLGRGAPRMVTHARGVITAGHPRPRASSVFNPFHDGRFTVANDSTEKAINCTLAEFSALRSEIDDLGRAQRAVINLNISTAAAIIAFVLSQRASPLLLLVAPFASSAFGFLYETYTLHIRYIGDYIDQNIRPIIVGYTNDDRLFGWESHVRSKIYTSGSSRLAMQMAFTLLMPVVPAVSLVWVLPYLTGWYWVVWSGGVLLYIVQMLSWIKNARGWMPI